MPVPGQEFGNAPRRVVSDAGEHVSEVVLASGAIDRDVCRLCFV